ARTLRDADAITVPTAFMASLLAPHGAQAAIVPSGVDPSRFPLRTRAEGPPWRLIRVGSLNAVKDYPMLLRALAALADGVRLDIVGEDTLGGTVQALASELGVAGRVTFHGWQPTERLKDLYAAAHLHVVSSRHEACGVSMLEAASAGIPTVGTRVGHIADWEP